ncbi:MAG: SH3 domain-containing protein [Gammaproteobacteria bacterium]
MEETTLTLSDYWRVLKRRRWNMFFTFAAIMVLSLLVAFGLPAKYRSSALIMIEGQDIPEDLVRSTITSFADERVQRITQRAMTSVNLSRIIDEHDLFASKIERVPRSEIIEDMREDITIDLVAADVIDPRSGRPTKATIAFSIAFDYSEPIAAQKVANQLVSLYRSVNLEEGESQVEGAADFLGDLAQTHRDQVELLESRFAELKLKNGGATPEFLISNMQLLTRMETELATTEAKLQSVKNRIIILEAQLLQTDPSLPGRLDGGATTPEQALSILESELRIAQSQYGNEHPSVRQYKRMVAELRREKGLGDNADVGQIDADITDAENQLETARARYGEEHPEIVGLKRRISNLRNSRVQALESILNGTVTPSDAVVSEINIREGPGTDTQVIGTLARDERATLVDTGNDQWFKIVTDAGVQGYVSRSVSISEAPQPIATAATENASASAQDVPTNPAFITLRANLLQAQSEAEGLLALYRNLQTKLEEKQSLIDRTPLVEREYSALVRELTSARMRLEDSSAKAEEARIGVKIVKDGKAQAFNLLEPPIAATQPHWPNRWALLFLGFVLSLLGTLAAAAVAENIDDSVRSASDIAELGGGPPLAMIPLIENSQDASSSRKGVALVGLGAAVVVAIILALVHFLYRPLDVVWYLILRKIGL